MKIDLATIDRERFHVNPRTIQDLGDFVLIVPHKAMWSWNEGEHHLRSLLCRPDGTVVSAGFPKFFNYGENAGSSEIVAAGIREKRTTFTEKVDGSLIIRSVINGRVHFRTRGCDQVASDMKDDVENLIREKYSVLLVPELSRPSSSLLMEYIAPGNQVVIRYSKPELVGLGWVDFSGDELVFYPLVDEMRQIGLERFMRPVRTFGWDGIASAEALGEMVDPLDGDEGIVTWTQVSQLDGRPSAIHLCKFKTAWYKRLHALRSQATPRYLKEFCHFNSIKTLDQLKEAFYKEGFDWEVVSYVQPLFEELQANVEVVEARLRGREGFIEDLVKLKDRKLIAVATKTYCDAHGSPELFNYLLMRGLGEEEKASEARDALLLDMSIQQLRNLKKHGPERLGAGKAIDDG